VENSDTNNEYGLRRPRGMTLLSGLYLFFLLVTVSSFGQPIPFCGTIYQGKTAELLVYVDSLICLYLFLGLLKRQRATWYLLLGYNCFELVNTLTNLLGISQAELEKIIGEKVDSSGVVTSNVSVMVSIILLSIFIYRLRDSFTNRSKYLFK
jgi:hypothetical protein